MQQKVSSSPQQPFRRHFFSLLLPFNYSESINKTYLLKIAASFFKKNRKWMNNVLTFRIIVLKENHKNSFKEVVLSGCLRKKIPRKKDARSQ